jgi:phage shock protein A
MNSIFKAMHKKKRLVDPNAPPRPNLMSHDKTIRDMKSAANSQADTVAQLQQRVRDLESKLANQTAYLQALHQAITAKSKG